ncbi:MAG: cobalamin-binding protein [Polyangiaceae bacterium]|nr:cobalamin-binding protein [Polyangiaceae bacterium]
MPRGPRRIICLTEEPTEILYALGEQERIVGISAYTERPAEARRDKPVVSAFIGGSVSKICALKPDLVIGFSDIQADLASKLIAAGLQVLIFNQRSLDEILEVILTMGRLVGEPVVAEKLVGQYLRSIEIVRQRYAGRSYRPRVYFEEWNDPIISGIAWVSELIDIAGGRDVFAKEAMLPMAKDRVLSLQQVVDADPEVYIGCWCGKAFDSEAALSRPGMRDVAAVRDGRVYEMDPCIILQPGPACLTDGLTELERLIWLEPAAESGSQC